MMFLSGDHALYVTLTKEGAVVLCDASGHVIDGQIRVVMENGVEELTQVTATLNVAGWQTRAVDPLEVRRSLRNLADRFPAPSVKELIRA